MERAADAVAARLGDPDPQVLTLVAIDGPGRLDGELAAFLEPAAVVRMEDFARPVEDGLDAQASYELRFDWGRLVEDVLDPIAVGQPGRYDRNGGVVEVPAHGLVVIDGPFSARPQLRGYYDLIVWVDGPTTGRPGEDWYAANVGPPADALVVSAGR